MRCWHSYAGSHERFVADMLTAEDETVTEKPQNPYVPELKSHRASIRPRITAGPENAGLWIPPDDLPSPERRAIVSGDDAFDRMAHVTQLLNHLLGNSLFQAHQSGRTRLLDLKSQTIQRLLRLQTIIQHRHSNLNVPLRLNVAAHHAIWSRTRDNATD